MNLIDFQRNFVSAVAKMERIIRQEQLTSSRKSKTKPELSVEEYEAVMTFLDKTGTLARVGMHRDKTRMS